MIKDYRQKNCPPRMRWTEANSCFLPALLLHVTRAVCKPEKQSYIAKLESINLVPTHGRLADGRKLHCLSNSQLSILAEARILQLLDEHSSILLGNTVLHLQHWFILLNCCHW